MLNLKDLEIMEDRGQYPDMHDLLEEKCPQCNGEYHVGDYVCWDMCYACAKRNGLLPQFLS
jgi:hypothetical protein